MSDSYTSKWRFAEGDDGPGSIRHFTGRTFHETQSGRCLRSGRYEFLEVNQGTRVLRKVTTRILKQNKGPSFLSPIVKAFNAALLGIYENRPTTHPRRRHDAPDLWSLPYPSENVTFLR